jgi:hypothetical protein
VEIGCTGYFGGSNEIATTLRLCRYARSRRKGLVVNRLERDRCEERGPTLSGQPVSNRSEKIVNGMQHRGREDGIVQHALSQGLTTVSNAPHTFISPLTYVKRVCKSRCEGGG